MDKNTLDRDDGLADLEALSLVNNLNGRFSMLPLTKLLASDLFKKNSDKGNLTQKWKQWIIDYVHEYGREDWDARGFRQIDQEIDNILAFIETGLDEEWKEVLDVMRFTTYYMKISGRWAESNRQALAGLELAKKLQDYESIHMFSSQSLAWTFGQQGKLVEAEKYAIAGMDAAIKLSKPIIITYSKRILGQIWRKQERYTEAETVYKEALEIVNNIENCVGMRGNLIGELGKIARAQNRLEDAERLFLQAIDLLSFQEADKAVLGGILGHMARLYLKMEKLESAEEYALKCLQKFNEIGGVTDIYYTLGRVYAKQGKKEKALETLAQGIQIFERLDMQTELSNSQKLIQTLQIQQ
jgi:tetratricopeptide (TPR) repeat protein